MCRGLFRQNFSTETGSRDGTGGRLERPAESGRSASRPQSEGAVSQLLTALWFKVRSER